MSSPSFPVFQTLARFTLWFCLGTACVAQNSPTEVATPPSPSVEQSLHELRDQIRELQSAVAEMRTENSRYQEEARQLRRELQASKVLPDGGPMSAREDSSYRIVPTVAPEDVRVNGKTPANSLSGSQSKPTNSADRLARLEEEYQLLGGKVDDQYQTKLESASKYRVRLSGIVLLNLFGNKGGVDNQDLPQIAVGLAPGASSGSVGASLRQSQLGLEVFGPHLAGARTTADLQMDFAGGFSSTWNGVNSGLVRLRTATVRFDWAKTSIVAGQDDLFFSPRTPTSFASLAVPALSYAGNLWSWTPQVRIERRFTLSENSSVLLQGGILDNLTGAFPTDSYFRTPQAGENSRQPAYASRIAWSRNVLGQKLTLGGAGYFGRQSQGFGRNISSWAGMADWNLPLSRTLSLSGKFYRGQALGGLGGSNGRSVTFNGDPAVQTTSAIPLNAMGGWSQLKFRPKTQLEFNAAFGQDSTFAKDVMAGNIPGQGYFSTIIRARGALANIIFRPRSDLLFSAEYHRLNSLALYDDRHSANQVNLVMGVLF